MAIHAGALNFPAYVDTRSVRQRGACEVLAAVECRTELHRAQMRSGPLYRLRRRIDTSELCPDGTLIRSRRLARVEAVLLLSRGGLSAEKLAQLAGLVDAAEAEDLVGLLNRSYDLTGSAFRAEKSATGYQLLTRPELVSWLDQLHERQTQLKLSPPMLETLTIIAYEQPVTRADVEAIRGVQSSEMIRQLIDRGLVKVGGEDDSLGRPFLYVTTRQFLNVYGLGKIEDLPDYESLSRIGRERTSAAKSSPPHSGEQSQSAA